MKTRTIIIISGVAVLLSVAGIMLYRQYKKLLNYCYKVKSFKILSIEKYKFHFKIGLMVRNNSDINIQVSGYDFKLYLCDNYVADLKSNVQQVLNKKSSSMIEIEASFNPTRVLDASKITTLVMYAVTDKSKFKIQLKGSVNVKTGIISLTGLPVDYVDDLANILTPSEPTDEKCSV